MMSSPMLMLIIFNGGGDHGDGDGDGCDDGRLNYIKR